MKSLQPLLADNKVKIDANVLTQLQYPIYASPKLDGIRLRIDPLLGGVSRTHKPIPNRHIQSHIASNPWLNFFDGEVIVGSPTAPDCFNRTQSAVMTEGGTPQFYYYVFDHWQSPTFDYEHRFGTAATLIGQYRERFQIPDCRDVLIVPQTLCSSPFEILTLEERYVGAGYEGLILRSPYAPYKNGRSTFREGILLKFKRLEDAEAKIIGFQPLNRNQNPQQLDAFGFAKRSSHKANKVADELLGALIVENPKWGTFTIGSGFDEATRYQIWNNQSDYLGKTVSFKYQPAGTIDKPRFPIWKGIRKD